MSWKLSFPCTEETENAYMLQLPGIKGHHKSYCSVLQVENT